MQIWQTLVRLVRLNFGLNMYLDRTFGLKTVAECKLRTWTEVSAQRKTKLNHFTFRLKYTCRPNFSSAKRLRENLSQKNEDTYYLITIINTAYESRDSSTGGVPNENTASFFILFLFSSSLRLNRTVWDYYTAVLQYLLATTDNLGPGVV